MTESLVIGIAGGSGSGKTTLSNRLQTAFPEQVAILCHDFYYKPFSEIPFEERVTLNYDHPESFDTELMVAQLGELKAGNPIQRPVYSFTEYTRLSETLLVAPKKVIIVEGILIYESKDLVDMMDIKAYVDTDSDIRLIRRLLRDVKKRGRDLDSVINQYMSSVKPMHDIFVEPSKRNADIIIPVGGKNSVAVEMLVNRIAAELEKE